MQYRALINQLNSTSVELELDLIQYSLSMRGYCPCQSYCYITCRYLQFSHVDVSPEFIYSWYTSAFVAHETLRTGATLEIENPLFLGPTIILQPDSVKLAYIPSVTATLPL